MKKIFFLLLLFSNKLFPAVTFNTATGGTTSSGSTIVISKAVNTTRYLQVYTYNRSTLTVSGVSEGGTPLSLIKRFQFNTIDDVEVWGGFPAHTATENVNITFTGTAVNGAASVLDWTGVDPFVPVITANISTANGNGTAVSATVSTSTSSPYLTEAIFTDLGASSLTGDGQLTSHDEQTVGTGATGTRGKTYGGPVSGATQYTILETANATVVWGKILFELQATQPTATPTFTNTPTTTPTQSFTFSPTLTITKTATPTPTWTQTATPTWTPTVTPTATPTNSPMATPTPTPRIYHNLFITNQGMPNIFSDDGCCVKLIP